MLFNLTQLFEGLTQANLFNHLLSHLIGRFETESFLYEAGLSFLGENLPEVRLASSFHPLIMKMDLWLLN